MRLLWTIHYPVFGGPHNQALRLRPALAAMNWETLVLLPDQPGNAAPWLQAGGVEVVQMPLHRLRASLNPRLHLSLGLNFLPDVTRIRRLIRERAIDLVLLGGLANPHAAIAARLEGVPVVWQVLDIRMSWPFCLLLLPIVKRCADALMFDGQTLIDLHLGSRPIDLPLFVYYPPVETRRFYPSAERRYAARRELNIPDCAPVVGMVANLNPEKGIEYFIRAASLIYRARPDSWFLLVGARYETHRRYTAQLEAEVQRSLVPAERFIFAGERPQVETYYAAMDVKLITSIREATTTTAMEAMACGVPVVATDVGAVHEVVEDGVTGFVVPPFNPAAIAHATLRLLQEPDLRAQMSAAGRRRAIERYDVEVCAETHRQAFEAAIARHRRQRTTPTYNQGVA